MFTATQIYTGQQSQGVPFPFKSTLTLNAPGGADTVCYL